MPTVSCRPRIDGEAQLGADAVGARHQHGLAVAIERNLHQRAEAADAAQHLAPHRALDSRLDALDELLAGVDIDAGLAVGDGCSLSHSIPLCDVAGAGPPRRAGQLWYFTSRTQGLRDNTMAQISSGICRRYLRPSVLLCLGLLRLCLRRREPRADARRALSGDRPRCRPLRGRADRRFRGRAARSCSMRVTGRRTADGGSGARPR